MDFIERGEIYSLEIFSFFFFLSFLFHPSNIVINRASNNIERERDDSFADFEAKREREKK